MNGAEVWEPCIRCGTLVCECNRNEWNGERLCSVCLALEMQKEEEERDSRACMKCGRITRSWERRVWRNGKEYCNECWKELEAIWVARNSCMVCGRIVEEWRAEEKMYPPDRIQAKDEWVKTGKVEKRFVCRKCFEIMAKKKFGVPVKENKHEQTPLLRGIGQLLGIGGWAR